MLKRLLMAGAVAGLMTGAWSVIQTDTALAGPSGCRQIAKAKFPGDMKARHAFKKECKARWKMAHGKKGGLFKKAA
jgi:hypothetical protein